MLSFWLLQSSMYGCCPSGLEQYPLDRFPFEMEVWRNKTGWSMAALVCGVWVTSKLWSGYPRDQNAELQLDPKPLLNGCGTVLKYLQCLGTESEFRTMHLIVAQSDKVQYFTSDGV